MQFLCILMKKRQKESKQGNENSFQVKVWLESPMDNYFFLLFMNNEPEFFLFEALLGEHIVDKRDMTKTSRSCPSGFRRWRDMYNIDEVCNCFSIPNSLLESSYTPHWYW